MLGSSKDGTYVYFAATGVLSSDGATEKQAPPKQADLYEWHEDTSTHQRTTTPVAAGLSIGNGSQYDAINWGVVTAAGPEERFNTSRVTPDGTTVLFGSVGRLTSYDNAGEKELYLYKAGGRLRCVSCNPTGAAATSSAHLYGQGESGISPYEREIGFLLTRNLSEDGSRVFFDTEEALVPQDGNGEMNVYEWEREGAGSCPSGRGAGCLYLISTGTSTSPSYFGDASADGSDVFFFTRQSLVSQDQDYNVDVYDARVDGGIAAQNPTPAAPCAGEVCHGVPAMAPQFAAPSSATFSGAGNLTPALASPVAKPATKSATRAQQLAKALKACKNKPKKKRAGCKAQARKKYAKKASKSARVEETVGRGHS